MKFPQTPIIDTFDRPDTTVAPTPAAAPYQGVGNTPMIDDFDRPNENPVNGGIWLPNTYGFPPPYEQAKIVNGNLVPHTAQSGMYIPSIEGGDQEAWATIASLPVGTDVVIVGVRDHVLSDPEASLAVMVRSDGSCVFIFTDPAFAFIQPNNQPAGTIIVGDRVGIRVEGTTAKMWRRRAGQNTVLAQTTWTGPVAGGWPSIYFSGLTGALADFGGGHVGLPGWWVWAAQGAAGGIREGVVVGLPSTGSTMYASRGPEDANLLPLYSLGAFEIYCDIEYDPSPGAYDNFGQPIVSGVSDIELWMDQTPLIDPALDKYVGIWQTSRDYVFFDFGTDTFDVTFPILLTLARGDGIGLRGDETGWSIWHRPGRSGEWVQVYLLTWAEVDQILVAGGQTSTADQWRASVATLEFQVRYDKGVATALKNIGGGQLVAVGTLKIVSFTDYVPTPRFDNTPWRYAQVFEAPAETGPWTQIDTITLLPVDADPSHPQARSFTTDGATLDEGWYKVRFVDQSGDYVETDPIQNLKRLDSEYLPTLRQVALTNLGRTLDQYGNPLGTFTSATRPTDTDVEGLILLAGDDVRDKIGGVIPSDLREKAQRVIALRTSMIIELSYFSSEVAVGRSPYAQIKELYDELLPDLIAAVEAEEGGATTDDATSGSGRYAEFGFEDDANWMARKM